jgi:hypothetical protein
VNLQEKVFCETGQAPESAEGHMGQGGITIRKPVWQEGFVLNTVIYIHRVRFSLRRL